MSFKFSKRSKERMRGVHPDIVAVMNLAIQRTPIDFTVLEGLRSKERQTELVRNGASKTMNSRHLTGHALDVAPMMDGKVSWDWPLYHQIAPVIKECAEELGVDLEWGGDWTSFKDGPHWQLSWNSYRENDLARRARLTQPDVPPRMEPDAPSAAKATEVPAQGFWAAIVAAILSIFGGNK